MKRIITLFIMIFMVMMVLGACNDKKDNEDLESGSDSVESAKSDSSEAENEEATEEDDDSTSLLKSIEEAEDQLDLSIGDTGSFVTTLGTYDMTITSAESKGYEFEGIESELDDWILLDVIIKNTSDEPLNAEDLMSSMELTEDQEGSGYMDSSGAFESVNEFDGEIDPGEEQSAQFIAYAFESDVYYFRKSSGNVAGGSSNQVVWNINSSDMKK